MVRNKMRLLLSGPAIILAMACGAPANAAWYVGSISKMQIAPDSSFIVFLSAPSNNECGSTYVRFTNTSAASLKMVFGALLAYQAQGIPIQFSITSCSGIYGVFEYIESTPQ